MAPSKAIQKKEQAARKRERKAKQKAAKEERDRKKQEEWEAGAPERERCVPSACRPRAFIFWQTPLSARVSRS